MKEVATVRFVEVESKSEAIAIIRASSGLIGFALSVMNDGDIEVFLEPQDCRTVITELQRAVAVAESNESPPNAV